MKYLLMALVCTAALAWPGAAAAAGGGGGGSGSGGADDRSAQRDRDADFSAGMAAVAKQDWPQAVTRMNAYTQRAPDDAEGWNQLGYAYRNAGQLPPAFAAYDKAIKLDPRHRGAREYLGEAYLQTGDVARAEQELKVLDKLCFFPCKEYSDLKRSIETHRKAKTAGTAPAMN